MSISIWTATGWSTKDHPLKLRVGVGGSEYPPPVHQIGLHSPFLIPITTQISSYQISNIIVNLHKRENLHPTLYIQRSIKISWTENLSYIKRFTIRQMVIWWSIWCLWSFLQCRVMLTYFSPLTFGFWNLWTITVLDGWNCTTINHPNKGGRGELLQ